jgi:hypothetical protein
LGLEAQQEALSRFAETEGFELVRTFVEMLKSKQAKAVTRLSVGHS